MTVTDVSDRWRLCDFAEPGVTFAAPDLRPAMTSPRTEIPTGDAQTIRAVIDARWGFVMDDCLIVSAYSVLSTAVVAVLLTMSLN